MFQSLVRGAFSITFSLALFLGATPAVRANDMAPVEIPPPRDESREAQQKIIAQQKAACTDNAEACVTVGEAYEDGEGVEQSQESALDHYKRACDQGEVRGCASIARLGRPGTDGRKKAGKELHELLTAACERESYPNCAALGELYFQGDLGKMPFWRGSQLFSNACLYGRAPACAALGRLHAESAELKEAKQAAAELMKTACDKDFKPACGDKKFEAAPIAEITVNMVPGQEKLLNLVVPDQFGTPTLKLEPANGPVTATVIIAGGRNELSFAARVAGSCKATLLTGTGQPFAKVTVLVQPKGEALTQPLAGDFHYVTDQTEKSLPLTPVELKTGAHRSVALADRETIPQTGIQLADTRVATATLQAPADGKKPELQIKGLKPGFTTITVRDEDGELVGRYAVTVVKGK